VSTLKRNCPPVSILPERIHNLDPLDPPRILKVFGEEHLAASLLSHPEDQRIPERKSVKPVKVNGAQDVGDLRGSNVELGKQFNLAAGH
jgi:hypothetical protein